MVAGSPANAWLRIRLCPFQGLGFGGCHSSGVVSSVCRRLGIRVCQKLQALPAIQAGRFKHVRFKQVRFKHTAIQAHTFRAFSTGDSSTSSSTGDSGGSSTNPRVKHMRFKHWLLNHTFRFKHWRFRVSYYRSEFRLASDSGPLLHHC